MIKILVLFAIFCVNSALCAYTISFSSNSPGVLGANITVQAHLYWNGRLLDDKYRATWTDNGIKQHTMVVQQTSPVFNWTVSYPRSEGYHIGTYNIQVVIEKYYGLFYLEVQSGRTGIEVTDVLSGNMSISQNGTVRDEFVSVRQPVNQTIVLKDNDMALLQQATYVRTYWFVDCVYKGMTDNYSLAFDFNELDRTYNMEALVVGSYDVLPEPTTTTPAPTTTTTTTTTTSTTTTTTSTTTTTTPSTTTTTSTTPSTTTSTTTSTPATTTTTKKAKRKRDVSAPGENSTTQTSEFELTPVTQTPAKPELLTTLEHIDQPYVCFNQSSVAPDPKKTYGYFNKHVTVKAPINNVTFTGQTWLQHGDVLNLEIKCSGSGPYHYCLRFQAGEYNITGNETCAKYLNGSTCQFSIVHFFGTADTFSILVILENQVSKTINKVGINVYQAQTKSPLSVIIVPITFCLVAIIIIIFGVAYYIQHRSHFVVEVADFNFGDTQSIDDMEYKTFQKRLLDSVTDVFRSTATTMATTIHGVSSPSSSGGGDSGTTMTGDTSLKYGSMT